MSDTQNSSAIICETCGKKYPWNERIAGKRGKCTCGTIFRIPKTMPKVEDDLYDLAAPVEEKVVTAPVRPVVAPVASLAPVPADPVVAPDRVTAAPAMPATQLNQDYMPDGTPRRKGLKKEEPKPDYIPWAVRDLYIPLMLIPIGVVLTYIEFMFNPTTPKTIATATSGVIVTIALNLGMMIGGVFLASLGGGVSFFDKWPTTILKLIPVALIPSALAGIIIAYGGEMNGAILGNLLAVGLYWLMFLLLFRLPMQDTTICVMIFWIMRVAAAYGAYRIGEYKSGSWI